MTPSNISAINNLLHSHIRLLLDEFVFIIPLFSLLLGLVWSAGFSLCWWWGSSNEYISHCQVGLGAADNWELGMRSLISIVGFSAHEPGFSVCPSATLLHAFFKDPPGILSIILIYWCLYSYYNMLQFPLFISTPYCSLFSSTCT